MALVGGNEWRPERGARLRSMEDEDGISLLESIMIVKRKKKKVGYRLGGKAHNLLI
jgi:hypothetical protein